jgi:two-component system, LuxR family, response regulator FixJ
MALTIREIAPDGLRSLCVVEDDADERSSLATLFGGLGVSVRTYPSAEDLLETLDQVNVSMLVSELDLPGMSGIALLRRLRERGVRSPAILLGEDSDIPTAVDAIRAGAVDFIEKPFIDRILLRRVRAALESGHDD